MKLELKEDEVYHALCRQFKLQDGEELYITMEFFSNGANFVITGSWGGPDRGYKTSVTIEENDVV